MKKKERRGKKAVILLSGGMDSAVTLYAARDKGFKCRCLIFEYGQRHEKEIKSAKRIATAAGCPYEVIKIKLPWRGSSLLEEKRPLPVDRRTEKERRGIPSTYVPARNTIFLSFALSWAEAIGAEAVFIGAHCRDFSGYPDCRPEYFKAFGAVVRTLLKPQAGKKRISIKVPLLYKTKREIVRTGLKLGVPFELTWSCYLGGKIPCGRCDACILRREGFRKAGAEDPGNKK